MHKLPHEVDEMSVTDFYALLFFLQERREAEQAAMDDVKGEKGSAARATGVDRLTPQDRIALLEKARKEKACQAG